MKITSRTISEVNHYINSPIGESYFKDYFRELASECGIISDKNENGQMIVTGENLVRHESTFAMPNEFTDSVEAALAAITGSLQVFAGDMMDAGYKMTHISSMPKHLRTSGELFSISAKRSKDKIEISFACEARCE